MIAEQNTNSAINKHFKLQIKILQNAPRRDEDRLEDRNSIIRESKRFSLYDDDDPIYWILAFNSKQLL
jgi:hypothetical protein